MSKILNFTYWLRIQFTKMEYMQCWGAYKKWFNELRLKNFWFHGFQMWIYTRSKALAFLSKNSQHWIHEWSILIRDMLLLHAVNPTKWLNPEKWLVKLLCLPFPRLFKRKWGEIKKVVARFLAGILRLTHLVQENHKCSTAWWLTNSIHADGYGIFCQNLEGCE